MANTATALVAILMASALLPLSTAAATADSNHGNQVVPCGVTQAEYAAYFRYPVRAQKTRQEGSVLLTVHVAADGTTKKVVVSRSSGSGDLDRAARAAARSSSFCKLDGRTPAAPGLADLRVDYRMNDLVASR